MTLPIRARLAIVSGVLVGGLVVGLGAVVYLRLEADLRASADDGLQSRAESIIGDPPTGSVLAIDATDVGDVFAQLLTPGGVLIATTPGLAPGPVLPARELAGLDASRSRELTVQTVDEPVLARVLEMPAPGGQVLVVGVAFDDQREALDRLLVLFGSVGPLAVGLAGAVGWLVVGAALRPVERMRLEAEAISGSEPGRRLPVPRSRDELAALGVSLNRMLDRLEAAVERERRFVADASHELRTPLANLKAEVDLALGRARTSAELVEALRSASEETDRLSSLAEDLLLLASADGGHLPIRRETVDLQGLIRATVDSFAGRAGALGVALEASVADGLEARLDPARMRQALGDLIENALEHTPAGGHVTVDASVVGDQVSIVVADTGEGFVTAFLPEAFEAFTRADASRSRALGGAGLGLAIVRAVAEAHGGTVEARNGTERGAVLTLRIPA